MSLSLTELVSAEVFALLQPRLPEGSEQRVIQVEEEAYLKGRALLERALRGDIYSVYDEFSWQDILGVTQKVALMLEAAFSNRAPQCDALLQQLEHAFTLSEYRGTAPLRFRLYLERCWDEYQRFPGKYSVPVVAIVQSSGFGKSRLVRELALTTIKDGDGSMGALYTCRRPIGSTGYPLATPTLQQWLFGADQPRTAPLGHLEATLIDRLVTVYIYTQAHWKDGRTKWLELFTLQSPSLERNLNIELKKLESELRGSHRGWETKCAAFALDHVKSKRLLVLTVDEAGTLLSSQTNQLNSFRLLRRALSKANDRIASKEVRKKGFTGGIFGVLVDTNSSVNDLTPPLSQDSSSRNYVDGPQLSFPPFVLSDTMDLFWQEQNILPSDATSSTKTPDCDIDAYKVAIEESDGENWKHLVRMGRPLWFSICTSTGKAEDVLRLAARKLLVGCDPDDIKSYNKATMFGVASMLCRLGLRPYITSPLASRIVADFMAILAYVKFDNEGYLVSYAFDPVLSLGAAYIWHSVEPALRKHILPQLKQLLLDEALDVGGIGEVVARIVLLLAVDVCVMKQENKAGSTTATKSVVDHHTFRGQFVNAGVFMETLVSTEKDGVEIPVKEKGKTSARGETQDEFEKWRSQWNDWQMGFSHFVQLELEPNEDTLWYLLGRYAAGIFPRNQNGADLVIPMFRRSNMGSQVNANAELGMGSETTQATVEVSMLLIQVKNMDHDSGFSKAATTKLYPSYVFSDENPFHKISYDRVIRIYLCLREEPAAMFIYAHHVETSSPAASQPAPDSSTTTQPDVDVEAKAVTSDVGKEIQKEAMLDDEESQGGDAQPKKDSQQTRSPGSASGKSNPAPAEKEDPIPNAFTYCVRSMNYPKIMDCFIAAQLSDLLLPLWNPMGLVEGDLAVRKHEESKSKEEKNQPLLSAVAGDAELKACAPVALARAPGLIRTKKMRGKRNASEISTEASVVLTKKAKTTTPAKAKVQTTKSPTTQAHRNASPRRAPAKTSAKRKESNMKKPSKKN